MPSPWGAGVVITKLDGDKYGLEIPGGPMFLTLSARQLGLLAAALRREGFITGRLPAQYPDPAS